MSRPDRPKPFLKLFDGKTTFDLTLERIRQVPELGAPLVVTGMQHRDLVLESLQRHGVAGRLVLEPEGRNTAAAVGLAALLVGDEMLVLPADHHVGGIGAFGAAVQVASRCAEDGYLVAFGVAPTEPSPLYGYVQPGPALGEAGAFRVESFVEKPDRQRAVDYIAQGYRWNSGMFQMRSETVIGEFERFQPQMLELLRASLEGQDSTAETIHVDGAPFGKVQGISFDYAIMENTTKAALVAANFDWSDLGSWTSIWSHMERDPNDNVAIGDVVLDNTRSSLVVTDNGKVVAEGIEDGIVVSSRDGVLVTRIEK